MIELRNELFAAPTDAWQRVPFTENHHKWLLLWCRYGDGGFCFSFISPRKRMYSYDTDGEGGRVTSAVVVVANGKRTVASYYSSWGDKLDRLDAVLRLTPKHILDRLHMLLDAIGYYASESDAKEDF